MSTTARRTLAAPLVLGAAALLTLTGCRDDDPPPTGFADAAADETAAEVAAGAPDRNGGDQATCQTVLTYGAFLPLFLVDGQTTGATEIGQVLDLIAAESEAYDAETPAVHDAALDVGAAAEEASDEIGGGADPVDVLAPVIEALDPLTEACAAAGVPVG